MATLTSISIEEDQFSCPVCLDVLRDPVTIPCGHSYCSVCIEDYWDRNKSQGYFCCPQCRQLFNPRPALSRNTVLSEVVGQIQGSKVNVNTTNTTTTNNHHKTTRRAVKTRLEPDWEAPELTASLSRPRERLCPEHGGRLRRYCWTDRRCVCAQCVNGKHRGHDTVSLAEARTTHEKADRRIL
ncbi:hypothetical protein CRUP_012603 [Coryphaenoides rupestris]|nr:hypothetical protein CRUP_012603 [Coryphaenoides rupestris]